jgi:predicted transposase YbfD/YdcC
VRGDRRSVSAYDTNTGIMLAQVQIAAKSHEIPAFTPLLRLVKAVLGSLDGVLVVADALHAQVGHAELLAADGAHLMAAIKANQPTLFDQVKSLPWVQIPIGAQTQESGHGRNETRTVKALTVQTPGGLGFPQAEQAVRITRTRTIKGKTSRETARPGPSIWAPGRVRNGTSSTACFNYETPRYVQTRIRPGPATAPPCSPPSWRRLCNRAKRAVHPSTSASARGQRHDNAPLSGSRCWNRTGSTDTDTGSRGISCPRTTRSVSPTPTWSAPTG